MRPNASTPIGLDEASPTYAQECVIGVGRRDLRARGLRRRQREFRTVKGRLPVKRHRIKHAANHAASEHGEPLLQER